MSITVSYVVAMDRDLLIGAGGGLPWRLPADLKHFREVTMGHPMLMGRRTWDSLPRQPLPGRRNLVVTRRADLEAPGAEVYSDLDAALAAVPDGEELMVIGGAEVFERLLVRADRLYVTWVEGEFEGDTWFPSFDPDDWRESASETREPDARNPLRMRFVTLERVRR